MSLRGDWRLMKWISRSGQSSKRLNIGNVIPVDDFEAKDAACQVENQRKLTYQRRDAGLDTPV
tara:strand:- start:1407 stop:1595 length:189 start_codon:yes stop_codon:yes gene_type:complete